MSSAFSIAVISSGRPNAVGKMQQFVGNAKWYVGKGEARFYERAGAKEVCESGGLCRSRNAALDDAFKANNLCVQVSDDLKKIGELVDGRFEERDFRWAIIEIASQMAKAKLGGIAPTANPFFGSRKVSTKKFIVGDLIVVAPCDLRFDEALTLKEDYDYTLQHLDLYGEVARCDWVLGEFAHRTNSGGAVAIRTRQKEIENINLLKAKWGDAIQPHPTRGETEIVLKRGARHE